MSSNSYKNCDEKLYINENDETREHDEQQHHHNHQQQHSDISLSSDDTEFMDYPLPTIPNLLPQLFYQRQQQEQRFPYYASTNYYPYSYNNYNPYGVLFYFLLFFIYVFN